MKGSILNAVTPMTNMLKYEVITSDKQYRKYRKKLEKLAAKALEIKEEIAAITLLTHAYKTGGKNPDPVEILLEQMKLHQLKSTHLSKELKISQGVISDIINYRKGFYKNLIRKL